MSIILDGTSGITSPNETVVGQFSSGSTFGFKNRIINGGMVIDQRNAGASVTPTADGTYTLDRWSVGITQSSKFSVQQSATAPTGFINSLLCTSLSAYTVASGDILALVQRVEGLNISDLGWGTANAATVTLSFWVRSSLTGTFGASIRNSAQNRSYPFSYSISSANTWEQKSVTIVGDTSGTWLTTNGTGINLSFGLGVGSTYSGTAGSWSANSYASATGAVSVVGTSGATFYITGVQLEKGSTATSFDQRAYGTELALCQRYFFNSASSTGVCQTSTQAYLQEYLKVPIRTSPSVTFPTTLTNILQAMGVGARTPTSCSAEAYSGDAIIFTAGGFSGTSLATGNPVRWNGIAIQVSAEL